MRLTRSQGLPWAVLYAVWLLAEPLTQWLPPGLCSILFLTGWQGLLFLPWRIFRYVMRLTRPQGLPRAVLSAAVSLLAALLIQ